MSVSRECFGAEINERGKFHAGQETVCFSFSADTRVLFRFSKNHENVSLRLNFKDRI